jgi:hypothetical protein
MQRHLSFVVAPAVAMLAIAVNSVAVDGSGCVDASGLNCSLIVVKLSSAVSNKRQQQYD